jgi:hypothetical protein
MLVLIGYLVVTYILQSKTMYAIAQRRGIENPWMAWVPFCNSWMLGAISDQYQQAVWGDVKNRRKSLLIWHIVYTVVISIYMNGYMIFMFAAEEGDEELTMVLALLFVMVALAMIAVSVIYMIQYYKALFDLFRSSDPGRSMMYLMLSIFVQFPLPFFMYSCRNKDDGMPAAPAQIPEIT